MAPSLIPPMMEQIGITLRIGGNNDRSTLEGITYGNNRFVVVGVGGAVLDSTNDGAELE